MQQLLLNHCLKHEQQVKHRMTQLQRVEFAKCLGLSRNELDCRIHQELETNPFLSRAGRGPATASQPFGLSFGPREGTDFSRNPDRDKQWDRLVDSVQNEESLQSKLIMQLHGLVPDPHTFGICEVLIANLDRRGYLACSTKEIEDELGVSEWDVSCALFLVQQLEPRGVGARNLRECLLLQIPSEFPEVKVELDTLVCRYLDHLAEEEYQRIAQDMGISVARVMELKTMLRQLDPCPGYRFSPGPAMCVRPDVIVEERDGEFVVFLPDDESRGLHVDADLKKSLAGQNAGNGVAKELRLQLRSAQLLLDFLELRRRTVLRVAQAIVSAQRDFLRDGVTALKPLKLRDIATVLKVHLCTVQRAVKGKYAQTPRGMIELSEFFSHAVSSSTGEGESISSKAAKDHLRQIVDREDRRFALNDTALVHQLHERGIRVARRTVVKYRRALRIPAAQQRRQAFLRANRGPARDQSAKSIYPFAAVAVCPAG